jgi:hypothetical protein
VTKYEQNIYLRSPRRCKSRFLFTWDARIPTHSTNFFLCFPQTIVSGPAACSPFLRKG